MLLRNSFTILFLRQVKHLPYSLKKGYNIWSRMPSYKPCILKQPLDACSPLDTKAMGQILRPAQVT